MFSYTSRKGVTYYVHARLRKKGGVSYVLRRTPEEALSGLPEGYEVVENVNGQASVRRARPRLITPEEEAQVAASLEAHGLKDYRVEVKGRYLTVFEPSTDPEEVAEVFDPLGLGGGLDGPFKDVMRHLLGDELIDRYIREKRQTFAESVRQKLQFFPVLRFELAKGEPRQFHVERRHYSGDGGWLSLATLRLERGLKRYVRHLGKDSFFELM